MFFELLFDYVFVCGFDLSAIILQSKFNGKRPAIRRSIKKTWKENSFGLINFCDFAFLRKKLLKIVILKIEIG